MSWTLNATAPKKDIIAEVNRKVELYKDQAYLNNQVKIVTPITQTVLDQFKPTDDQLIEVNVSVGGIDGGTAINTNVIIH